MRTKHTERQNYEGSMAEMERRDEYLVPLFSIYHALFVPINHFTCLAAGACIVLKGARQGAHLSEVKCDLGRTLI